MASNINACMEAQGSFIKTVVQEREVTASRLEDFQTQLGKKQAQVANHQMSQNEVFALLAPLYEQAEDISSALKDIVAPLSTAEEARLIIKSASLVTRVIIRCQKQMRAFWAKKVFGAIGSHSLPPEVMHEVMRESTNSSGRPIVQGL